MAAAGRKSVNAANGLFVSIVTSDLARGMARELHFDLFVRFQPGVVLARALEPPRPREFGRPRASLGEPLAQLGARDEQPVLVLVRAGASGGHSAAPVAPEGPVDLRSEEH